MIYYQRLSRDIKYEFYNVIDNTREDKQRIGEKTAIFHQITIFATYEGT